MWDYVLLQLDIETSMATKTNKKKVHHFVHDAYINAWRVPDKIFVFDLIDKKLFEATGRNSVGASGKYNNFSFDATVLSLLDYSLKERAQRQESGRVYEMMLTFMDVMKDHEYEHKAENFLEDFYGEIEAKIGHALRSVFRGEIQVVTDDPAAFDGLIFLYCLQLMRVPKSRRALSEQMTEIFYDDARLNEQQKDEYIKILLLIHSLAMSLDIIKKGCVISLRHARYGEKFINSDAPVIVKGKHARRIEDHEGSMALSPRLVMEISHIGLGQKIFSYNDIGNGEVEKINLAMIANAERMVYFSSRNHREKYLSAMRDSRPAASR